MRAGFMFVLLNHFYLLFIEAIKSKNRGVSPIQPGGNGFPTARSSSQAVQYERAIVPYSPGGNGSPTARSSSQAVHYECAMVPYCPGEMAVVLVKLCSMSSMSPFPLLLFE